ncbi:MAG: ABC transporter permease, partial [Pseudomonadota bacterium]
MIPYALVGAAIFAGLAAVSALYIPSKLLARAVCALALIAFGAVFFGLAYGILIGIVGWVLGGMAQWLHSGDYRLPLPPYASSNQVLWHYGFRGICAGIFIFLIVPIIILIPLSFNQLPYFSFTPEMLSLDPEGFSIRWYQDILRNGMVAPDAVEGWWADMWNNAQWVRSIRNSFYIGILATILSTVIGTLAAIGLSRSEMPWRRGITALLISPMIVPLVITASGLFFFFSQYGLAWSYTGIIIGHAILGTPFVIITVTATLSGFDQSLTRAAANMGAGPVR